jgi:hypothetical protein
LALATHFLPSEFFVGQETPSVRQSVRSDVAKIRAHCVDAATCAPLALEPTASLEKRMAASAPRRAGGERNGRNYAQACRCGLNPLLAYFTTGEAALDELIAQDALLDPPEQAQLRRTWTALARGEIDALCSGCQRTCETPRFSTAVRGALKPGSIDAAGRGRSSAPRRRFAEKLG